MLNDTVGDQAASLDSYRDRITNFSNEFDLGLFIYIVKRSLVWIAMCLLLAMGAAYIYLRYTAPTYASSATLQMGQSNKAQTVLKVSDMMDDNSLQADVQLLRSKFFIAKAVQALPLRVRYFFRGQILTEEHYRQSFFTVDRLNITNAAVEGRPINVQVMDDNSLRLDYAIGTAKFQIPVEPNVPFSTPHFSAVITSGSSRPWPKGWRTTRSISP
jgi:uncharacterized protein involved in exopolysaccharide biosynthesis